MLSLIAALTLQAAAPPPDFAWLTGHWLRETETLRSQEIWTEADGAVMTGMNRTVRADGRTAFEFIRIEFAPDGGGPPVYIAQPSGAEPVRFSLIDHSSTSATFANLDHDFPTHIAYDRDGDTLTARIWRTDGEADAIGWSWTLDGPD
ncbi:MAG: DUF6265 family protein [Oceanicaulis sp.]